MSNGLALDHWQDWAILVTLIGAVFTALGITGTQFYNRIASRRSDKAADDEASDRLIALIEREADKRVAIVRAEFELAIANLKLEHAKELNLVRSDFTVQIAEIKQDAEAFRCDIAPTCKKRHGREVIKVGGTDSE